MLWQSTPQEAEPGGSVYLEMHEMGAVGDAKVLAIGPCPAIDSPDPGPAGFSGSLIVAEFPSLEDATTWADADPYVAAGVYAKVTIKPFKKAFPT